MVKKRRIVIIGAGMAGLTAANKLYTRSNDMFELSVVEGGSRIGGRINTSEFSGERIEMGATWIHGIGGSPVYRIAHETGSLVSDEPWECMDSAIDKPRTFAEGGFELDPSILEPISGLFNVLMGLAQGKETVEDGGDLGCGAEIYDIATRVCSSRNGFSGRSVGSFLKSGFDAYWESVKSREEVKGFGNWSRKSLLEAIFAMLSNTQRTYTSADDLSTLDLAAESEYQMFPGEEITIAKGYLSVINHLASVLPQDLIQLNRKVTKIEWLTHEEVSDDPNAISENGFDHHRPVKLHFSDGSVVFADHVIVTVSLGVLKAGVSSEPGMFSPPLPNFKVDAIKRLGFGVVNKLFVEMTQRNFPSLQLVFDRADSELRLKKIPWWMRRTATISPIHSNSRVLLSWFAGKEAFELEKLTDDEIIDGVSTTVTCLTGKEVMKKMKNTEKKPVPLCNGHADENSATDGVKFTRVLKSKWGSDPLFLGSYSYVAVGSSGDDLDAMAEPLPKLGGGNSGSYQTRVNELQILFAGEATHRTHYSTTHGAYFSGLREANRLLHHYKCVGC
ncbi:PREDICTED: probable polyamine oxidase 5 [Tarenaya hassleriana]|uniref:probable polyamine oxidase 5 n=1 Tax=Tarenaya hassleriana TaxID=28532 RepID=UPI00053C908A|nr:PREDICTED: probable polyamine oxidase 5 [Tarenaya hassleriana]